MSSLIGIHHSSVLSLDCSTETIDQWVHELRDVSHNELKIKISQKSTNGDHFIPILRKIQNILQQLTIQQWKYANSPTTIDTTEREGGGEEGGGTLNEGAKLQLALRHLGSETIPGLIIHMSNISAHVEEMGKLLLDVISYLMALDSTSPLFFPTMYATCLIYINPTLWSTAVDIIIHQLCYYALPMAILYPHDLKGRLDSLSMSGTLMLVLDNHSCELRHHLSLTSVLMKIKLNACTDLLSVIAYGTADARTNALKLLIHYWPLEFPEHYSYNDPFANLEMPSPECTMCNNPANYLCLEGSCNKQKMLSKDGNKRLFSLLCPKCDGLVHRTIAEGHKRFKILQPLREVKPNCELRKVCVGDQVAIKRATVTCYGESCTAIQNGYPIRLCHDCHMAQHGDLNDPLHIYQIGPQNPWVCPDMVAASALLEAVAKLLGTPPKRVVRKESQRRNSAYMIGSSPNYSVSISNSREAIIMLRQYCTPLEPVTQGRQKEWLEHLIALLMEWFRLFNDIIEKMTKDDGIEEFKSFLQFLAVGHKTSDQVFSNHRELYGLLTDYAIPWLKGVCDSGNTHCIIAGLLPHPQGHVQVGAMWQYSVDDMMRYRRTLSIITLLVKNTILPQDVLDQIYNEVMPHWMDLLIELRNTPGEMDKLKDIFHTIFPSGANIMHEILIKRFEFIRETFYKKSSKEKQRALFWLQDLSRLSIKVPYTSHIFEGSVQTKRVGPTTRRQGSIDIIEGGDLTTLGRKDSTGSVSGYESESGLVSQTSVEGSDAIIQLNYALPRYILMLDIWYSQLMLDSSGLSYEVFQKLLVHMLRTEWGNTHSLQDHHDTSNTCILCQATSLWFSLAARITNRYIQEEEERDEGTDGGTPPMPKRGRVSKFAIPTLKKKLTQNDIGSTCSSSTINNEETWENVSLEDTRKKASIFSKSSGDTDTVIEDEIKLTNYVPLVLRDRRPPIMTRYTDDFEALSALTTPTSTAAPSNVRQALPTEQICSLYIIYQLSIEKLSTSLPSKKLNTSYKYHPDTMLQIIHMIHVLVSRGRVLTGNEKNETILKDSHKLLSCLWRIMECDSSYVHQSCVNLFIATQDGLIPMESPSLSSIQSTCLWSLLYRGFSGQGWETPFKTVDKLSMMLQFIAKSEGGPIVINRPQVQTELVLAQWFCKMVRLVQDKDSRVSTRVKYCLDNMKHESFEAIKTFLLSLFSRLPSYRGLVLQTLSLLNTTVSSYSFLSIPFFLQLLREEELIKPRETDEVFHQPSIFTLNQKKISDVSVLSGTGRGFKEARPSTTSSAFSVINFEEEEEDGGCGPNTDILQLHCDTLTLLLEYMGSQNSNFNETQSQTTRMRRITRVVMESTQKELTSENLVSMFERLVGKKFLIAPQVLCRSRIYETFIVKLYKIFDTNIEFSSTKSFLTFVICLLGYSVTPTHKDYPFINSLSDSSSFPKSCSIGYLPAHLQTPWLRVLFILLYKYSHLLVKLESTDPLLYCIEAIVNSLSSSVHVCPSSSSSNNNTNVIDNNNKGSDPSPNSPITETTESPLKTRSSILERKTLDPVPEESGAFNISYTPPSNRPNPPQHSVSITSVSSTFTSNLSTDHISHVLLDPNPSLCSTCCKPIDVYVEEVVSLCVLCLGTCCHRIPNLLSPYLVSWIIPCISKVAMAGNFCWQTDNTDPPPPGSGLSIARKFLLTILTQFAERKVFLYLFRHSYENEVIFNGVYNCLTQQSVTNTTRDEEEEMDIVHLNVSSPIKYFLEDAINSLHFTQEVNVQSLINLASYLELVPETFSQQFWNLSHLELFFKKLKEQTTSNVLYESFNSLLRVIIQLLKYCCDPLVNPVSSLTLLAILQELPEIISECFEHVYVPAGGLVTLVGVWYRAFLHFPSNKRREVAKKFLLLKHLIEEFSEGLSRHSTLLPENLISLCQCFFILLNEYAYFGYIDTLTSTRVYAPQLRDQEIHMGNLVNSCEGIEVAFHNALRYAVNYLACEQSDTSLEVSGQVKLTIAQLVVLRVNRSIYPLDIIRRIVEGQYSFSWVEKSSKSRNVSRHPPDTQLNGGGGNDPLQTGDHISSLMLLGWLLLGNLCHNSVHAAVVRGGLVKMGGILSSECEILLRLASPINKAVANILRLVICALRCLVNRREMSYWGLNCILSFCSIWTVYMELHVNESMPEIVNFWRMVVDVILELPTLPGMLMCKPDIVETFCLQIMIPLKKASSGVSSFSLLLPTWKRVISMLPNPEEAELPDYSTVAEVCMDMWFKDILKNFTELESKYLT